MTNEVKIDEVANKLPLDKWFTKVEFSELTGIKFKCCTRRINKIIENKMLIADYSHKKAYYMMTAECWRKMKEKSAENKATRKSALALGRKKKQAASSEFDALLFSTALI